MIDGHGDDIYRYGDKIKCNFSSNIYQRFDHGKMLRYLLGKSDIFSVYPEPGAESLERLIANRAGLEDGNVMVTAGSTDSIYLIAAFFRGARSLIMEPTFAEYEDACKIYGHRIEYAREGEISAFQDYDCEVAWICNPNNPTGHTVDVDLLERTLDGSPGTVFVIDMAYCRYTSAELPDFVEWTEKKNVIFLHSLTKRFGVPGLRVGYVTACQQIIDGLKTQRMPWSVSSIAQQGAEYLINHEEDYQIPLSELLDETNRLTLVLKSMNIQVGESSTNFILCRLPYGKASELKEFLACNYGVLIRDASNFRGLDDRYFRISAQQRSMNDILIEGIREWLCLSK